MPVEIRLGKLENFGLLYLSILYLLYESFYPCWFCS